MKYTRTHLIYLQSVVIPLDYQLEWRTDNNIALEYASIRGHLNLEESVIDHQLARQLIVVGQLNLDENRFEFYRL